MQEIKGQTALVTGGARRLGRAIALELAGAGMDVVIHYHRSESEAAATAAEARALGVRAVTIESDLSAPDAATDLFRRAVEAVGAIDILINNASIFQPGPLMRFVEEDLQANMHLHATVPLQLARCLAAAGRRGAIVNLLDTRIVKPDPATAPYSLSKCMLAELTRMLAVELGPKIRVNAVAPGLILAPEGQTADTMQARARMLPLQTIGAPADIAAAVRFLLCSTFVTGQVLYIDGGSHLL